MQEHLLRRKNAVTVIDIALEPDATMIQHAEAANARLLKVFPKGFSLDATHRLHISDDHRWGPLPVHHGSARGIG
jgi:hypothetical protein